MGTGGNNLTIVLVAGAGLFAAVLLGAFFLSKRRWNSGFTVCLVWAAIYPLVQGPLIMIGGDEAGWLIGLGIASALSAGLLCWGTRSFLPAFGCLCGWGLTAFEQPGSAVNDVLGNALGSFLLPAIWNFCVAGSMAGWSVWARRKVPSHACCAKCGYDLRGTPGRVCPECGGEGKMEKVG